MHDWFIGFQTRTVLNFKKDDVALSVPTSAIVAPGLAVWCWCECIRQSGKTGAGTTGSGARSRPLPMWSGFRPGGTGGRRHGEGLRPRGWDGWEGGRVPPQLYRAGPCSWRSSSTCASATRKTRRWPLASRTWPTHRVACTPAWMAGRRVRSRLTRATPTHCPAQSASRCAGENPSWRSCRVHFGHPRAPKGGRRGTRGGGLPPSSRAGRLYRPPCLAGSGTRGAARRQRGRGCG